MDEPGVERVSLPAPQPFHAEALAGFLVAHAVPGLEQGRGRTFARALTLPGGPGVVVLELHDEHVEVALQLSDPRDHDTALEAVRRLLDLDVDPSAVDAALAASGLGDLVRRRPGLRVPGSADVFETLVRTVVGQQVSVSGAATVTGRLVVAAGEPLALPLAREHGLTHAFPDPAEIAALDPGSLPMPRSRGRTVVGAASEVAEGRLTLDPGADVEATGAALLALRGIGPWTVGYVRMRALADPDVLLTTDLVLARVLEARGTTADDADAWSPWRSYAGMHLWTQYLAEQALRPARGSST